MPVTSALSIPKTPLDYIAEGYWQEFSAAHPIAGGIAYEAQLHDCQLDESLASLQRLDTLMTQIRRDLTKSGIWDEKALLADERYRNLLVFLAFYAGRVLARQWQNTPHWYGQFELRARYPELPLIADDFYQHMAVSYRPATDFTKGVKAETATPVFFALEPIGLRLFGHIDRQFQAVQGGQVASGLYQAVSVLLPNAAAHRVSPVTSPTVISIINKPSDSSQVSVQTSKSETATATTEMAALTSPFSPTQTTKPLTKNNKAATTNIDPESSPAIASTQADLPSQILPSKPVVTTPTPEIFTQLLTELDEIEVTQTAGNNDYQQARKILDQFERHIAKQNKPRAQVTFSESHQRTRQQALTLLQKAAALGNTTAMLRLAMYELLGEGLLTDNSDDQAVAKEAGVDWVKQAAKDKDIRAQRMLSKMYYQGVGVPQDVNNGQHWLEQAADNGHTEAATLVAQWQQAQTLITTQKQENHSIKRYQLLIGAVVLGALMLIIFV